MVAVIAAVYLYNGREEGSDYYISTREVTASPPLDRKTLSTLGLQEAFNRIADKNIPAVVSLHVETMVVDNTYGDFFDDDLFRWFFGIPESQPRGRRGKKYGSGFIISKNGYLISNHHVVEDAKNIYVFFLDNEKKYQAKIIGTDKETDIALLKIKSSRTFPFVILGDSERLKVGDLVVAIGNPLGLSHTFTTGVVSAKSRSEVTERRFMNFIQTDVAINPGNSGGPLINIYNEVVGMNSFIYSQNGGSIGLGFAIPINVVKNVVTQLKKSGRVHRGWFGIEIINVTEELAEDLEIEKRGVYVPSVTPDSPAEKGGLKAGDIILEFDGRKIKDVSQLQKEVFQAQPGQEIRLGVLRKKQKIKVKIEIQEKSQSSASLLSRKYLGIKVIGMSEEFLQKYDSSYPFGVVIKEIDRNSPLRRKGISQGDIILMINRQQLADVNTFNVVMGREIQKRKIVFHIQRENTVHVVIIYP